MKCERCKSENIYFSKKQQVYICEDCDFTFEKNEKTALNIFFSYGHDLNTEIVLRIKRDLEARGHTIWFDANEIKMGDDWRKKITEGISSAHEVVSFMSKHSMRDPGVCLDELKIAIGIKGCYVKTILLENEQNVSIPASISNNQWLDMSEWKEKENDQSWYNDKLKAIIDVIENDNNISFAGEIETLNKYLFPVFSTSKEDYLLKKDYFKRDELHKAVANWEQTNSPALILYGSPGSGKSIYIANKMHYDSLNSCAVFCEWNNSESSFTKSIIRTIAYKIASKVTDYRNVLIKILKERNQGKVQNALGNLSSHELFDFLISHPFNGLIDGGRPQFTVYIDGLDEINDRKEFLQILTNNFERTQKFLRFVLTARPEADIINSLSGVSEYYIDGNEQLVNEDLMKFIVDKINKAHFPLTNTVIKKIADFSQKSFLFCDLIVGSLINGQMDIADIDQCSAGISSFYYLNFQRLFQKEKYESYRKVLECLVFEPEISKECLVQLCGFDNYLLNDFLLKLGAWIYEEEITFLYTDKKLQHYQFVHKSLLDWLIDPKLSCEFYVDIMGAKDKFTTQALAFIANKKIVVKKPRRYVGHCPKIEIDLVLDFVQNKIADWLIKTESYDEYETLLLEDELPLLPYLKNIDQLPQNYDLKKLEELLNQRIDKANEAISSSKLSAVPMALIYEFYAEAILTKRLAEPFIRHLTRTPIPGFFFSSASDAYNYSGIPYLFNEDKINIAYYLSRIQKKCEQNSISLPQNARQLIEITKVTCLYCEGQADYDSIDSLETIGINFPYLFENNFCDFDEELLSSDSKFIELKKHFNGYALYRAIISDKPFEHCEKIVQAGVDFVDLELNIAKYIKRIRKTNQNMNSNEEFKIINLFDALKRKFVA